MFDHLNIPWPIVAGDDEELVLVFIETDGSASDMTGRTFACELRQVSKSGADPADFTCSVVIATNTVTFALNNAQTRSIFSSDLSYFWDVQQSLAGKKYTIVGGPIELKRDSTT